MSSLLLQLDSKAESELKDQDEDDYAMNSESYLEVRLFILDHFKGSIKPLTVRPHLSITEVGGGILFMVLIALKNDISSQ